MDVAQLHHPDWTMRDGIPVHEATKDAPLHPTTATKYEGGWAASGTPHLDGDYHARSNEYARGWEIDDGEDEIIIR